MLDDLPRTGPSARGPDYDNDFYAWTQHQASVLREMAEFDSGRAAEEVEDLGKSERGAVHIRAHRIKEHFLKVQQEYGKADPAKSFLADGACSLDQMRQRRRYPQPVKTP